MLAACRIDSLEWMYDSWDYDIVTKSNNLLF